MRCYPRNSPHAAARILALTLLADGHLSRTELNALVREDVARELGLSALDLDDLLRHVAEDVLATGAGLWQSGGRLHDAVVASALAEIDAPELRHKVLALCQGLAHADGHLSDGEEALLQQVTQRWNLHACIAS
jgi:uncharacterized tellurite resistance protein B-like protein